MKSLKSLLLSLLLSRQPYSPLSALISSTSSVSVVLGVAAVDRVVRVIGFRIEPRRVLLRFLLGIFFFYVGVLGVVALARPLPLSRVFGSSSSVLLGGTKRSLESSSDIINKVYSVRLIVGES